MVSFPDDEADNVPLVNWSDNVRRFNRSNSMNVISSRQSRNLYTSSGARRPDDYQPYNRGRQSSLLTMSHQTVPGPVIPSSELFTGRPRYPSSSAGQLVVMPTRHEPEIEELVTPTRLPANPLASSTLEENILQEVPTWRRDMPFVAVGVFVFCSTPLWSMPFAIHEGGWYGLIFFFFFIILTFFTAWGIPYCIIDDVGRTYPDLGLVAFGDDGRLAISVMSLIFSYATCIDCLMLLRDNLRFLSPEAGYWPTITFLTWLIVGVYGITLDEYSPGLPGVGIVLAIIVLVCLVVVTVNGTGLNGITVPFNSSTMHTAIGFYSFCFCGHSYMPRIFASVRSVRRYHILLFIIYVISVTLYVAMGWIGYRMFGSQVNPIVTLNLTSHSIARQIAIYSMIFHQVIRYALNLTPVAITADDMVPQHLRGNRSRFATRSCLVIVSLFATLAAPNYGTVVSLSGSFIGVLMSLIIPSALSLRIRRNTLTRGQRYGFGFCIMVGVLALLFIYIRTIPQFQGSFH